MKHIMIVDDHPIVREGLANFIEIADDLTVVATASNGQEALEKLAALTRQPDLILVDLQMPEMSGKKLLEKLPMLSNVLIFSTEIDGEFAQHFIQKGVRGYLSLQACRQAGFTPSIAYTGKRAENIIDLVSKGMGISLLMAKPISYINT